MSLAEFVSYECNLAFNRQTRMLAAYDSNFTLCGYLQNKDSLNGSLDDELLERAKQGLRSLAFFGLTEFHTANLALFQKTFNDKLLFGNMFDVVLDLKEDEILKFHLSDMALMTLDWRLYGKIVHLNRLDIELYKYATQLFAQRLKSFHLI